MSTFHLALALLLFTSLEPTYAAVYEIMDLSYEAPGGYKYAKELNIRYKGRVLHDATEFVWKTFHQKEGEGRNYDRVILVIESFTKRGVGKSYLVASTVSNTIRINADYLIRYNGDVKDEFAGVVYHEMTRVWQWTGKDMAPSGLISGIADYVRLKSGYASKSWTMKGSGSSWNEGYAVTAHFLNYCNDLKEGFIAELNALMEDSYSEDFFLLLLGKSVDELWRDYKLKYEPESSATLRKTEYPVSANPSLRKVRILPTSMESAPKIDSGYQGYTKENAQQVREQVLNRAAHDEIPAKALVESSSEKCNGIRECYIIKFVSMIRRIIRVTRFKASRKLGIVRA